jgi:tape measure domain-containing protein
MEQAQIGFTTMLGSAEKTQAFIAEMQQFAKKTPFQYTDVQTAAEHLLAFGLASKDVLPTLTAVGDAAAALGTGAEGVQRITTALGQIKAKGRIQSDELLQLYEAGIPALDILAKKLGKTTKETQDMVTKGLVPADVAITALTEGMEQRFGGLMEKQSHTLGGMFSNLQDTITLGSDRAFKPLSDQLKYYLPGAIKLAGREMDALGRSMERASKWAERNRYEVALLRSSYQYGGFDAVVRTLDLQTQSGGRLNKMWEHAKQVVGDAATVWKSELKPAVEDLGPVLGAVLSPLGAADDILHWMADHPTAGRAIFEGMAIAITSWKLAELLIGVRNAMIGVNLAMAANPWTVAAGAAIALAIASDRLFTKLNPGASFFERITAVAVPMAGSLLTIAHHLDDILKKLGLVDDKKKAVAYGPWPTGQSPAELQQKKNTTLKKSLPTGVFPTLGVPAMATGGVVSSAGLSLVGERGPELLSLPRASRVDPLPDGGGSLGPSIVIHPGAISVVTSDPERAATLVVEKIQDMAARK